MKNILSKKIFLHQASTRGFTLIEAMIAVFAFALVFTASLGMIARALRGNQFAMNELTAQYLATEGLESGEAIRSNQALIGAWVHQIIVNCTDGCAIDPTPLGGMTATACTSFSNPCAQLYTSSSATGALYTHQSGGIASPFRRIIYVTQSPTDGTAIILKSEVQWSMPGLPDRSIAVRKIIKNWY